MMIPHSAREKQVEDILSKASEEITEIAKNYIMQFMVKWPFFSEYQHAMGVSTFTVAEEFREKYTGFRTDRWGYFEEEAFTDKYIDTEEYTYPPIDFEKIAKDIENLTNFLNEYDDMIHISSVKCNKRFKE